METEGMDNNISKFEEDIGVSSGIFCRVPDHLFPFLVLTIRSFFKLAKQIKATATTLQDSGFFLLKPWLVIWERVVSPALR